MLTLVIASAPAMPAIGQDRHDGVLLSTLKPADGIGIAVGEQLLIEGRSGALRFGGGDVALDAFTGVIGYASELAYVAVIDGTAAIGNLSADAGSMLLIPPYGAAPSRQRFDAERFASAWSDAAAAAHPAVHARLGSIASGQRRGRFLGRFARTKFNVAAPGSVDQELATRTIKGNAAVQTIRFSGEADPAAIERKVVDSFLGAIVKGDVVGLAGLIDPVPFGNTDLRGEAENARRVMAGSLIGEWGTILREAQAARMGTSNIWILTGPNGSATLTLRPIGDFVFVGSISAGGQS